MSAPGNEAPVPGRYGPRGAELLMTMSFGEDAGGGGAPTGVLSPCGYDPESPTRALLQIPSPSGSPVPVEWGGSSDGEGERGPPLHGVKVELSPKEKNGRRKYPPYPGKVMTSKDIFGSTGMGSRPGSDEPEYSVNYFGVHQGEMGVLSQKRKIPKVNKDEVIRPRTTASGSKASNPRLQGLTPFGKTLAEAVLPQEELMPPNIRLDPSYTYLRSNNTAPAFSDHMKLYKSQVRVRKSEERSEGDELRRPRCRYCHAITTPLFLMLTPRSPCSSRWGGP